jgi:hypothetical protein
MKPPKKQYEQIKTDDFVTGVIDEVVYEMEHEFKFKEKISKKPAVRLKLLIDGYKEYHYTRWMTFNYSEKSNLLKKYLIPLVENAHPNMDFEMDLLKGMKVKMLWKDEKNGFQSIDVIRPIDKKLTGMEAPPVVEEEPAQVQEEEPVPF